MMHFDQVMCFNKVCKSVTGLRYLLGTPYRVSRLLLGFCKGLTENTVTPLSSAQKTTSRKHRWHIVNRHQCALMFNRSE